MNLTIEKQPFDGADEAVVENILKAISSSRPAKSRRDQEVFSRLFPALREALEQRGVTRKEILLVLAAQGLKMSSARFKSLYHEEAKRQSEQLERGAGA